MVVERGELASLLSLLDDPDKHVSDIVLARLRGYGKAVLPSLIELTQDSSETLVIERASSLAREINLNVVAESFRNLLPALDKNARPSLERGAFLLAQFGNPVLDFERYKSELEMLSAKLRDRVSGIQSPFDILIAVNNFFFEEQKFKGNDQNFLEAENSYIDQVIDRRIGIPISLAVVYLLIARDRLGLPFSGASAPGHFLIRYDGVPDEPLFIDAFNGGVVLRRRDIERFLEASRLPFSEAFLAPSPARVILLRMMRNLVLVFKEAQDSAREEDIKHLIGILAPHETDSE
jgi:regulator of sirC expression with transglutaminase-like and TPR domain